MSVSIRVPGINISSAKTLVSAGYNAGSGTSDLGNVVIGAAAGTNITTGSSNVVIGAGANAPADSFYNTVIGANASITGTATGSIALGYMATSDKSGACVFGGPPSSGAAISVQDTGGRMYYTANDDDIFDGAAIIAPSGAELFDGIILMKNINTTTNLIFPSAVDIIAELPNPVVGACFYCKVVNDNSSDSNVEPTDSADGTTTYAGITALRPSQTGNMLIIVTSITSGSESVVVYN